jgi:hypothetical protein
MAGDWKSGRRVQVGGMGAPEDGGSMDLRNVGILQQHYTESQPRRPRPESSLAVKTSNVTIRE